MWKEQCDATPRIRNAFGIQQALNYLIGEKFLDFIEAAEFNEDLRAELPEFAARIKLLFEPAHLAAYLAPVDRQDVIRDSSIVRCASPDKLVTAAWQVLAAVPS